VLICAKCGRTEKEVETWYFCKKCQVHLCFWCVSGFLGLNPCPICKETKYLVRVK
jgi:hypothetical protein